MQELQVIQVILLLLLGAVAYLIYKVNRLERLLERSRRTSRPLRTGKKEGNLIPLLRDDIEPGPFKAGNQRREMSRKDPEE